MFNLLILVEDLKIPCLQALTKINLVNISVSIIYSLLSTGIKSLFLLVLFVCLFVSILISFATILIFLWSINPQSARWHDFDHPCLDIIK